MSGGCSVGCKQTHHMHQEETTSATDAIDSLFTSATMDTDEKPNTNTTEVSWVFMQAYMVGNIHVKLASRLEGLLTRLDPKIYEQYINF